MQPQLSLGLESPLPAPTYAQRGTNDLQNIFREHFQEFAENYEQKYAPTYGRFRLKRITQVAERFLSCGDYTQGIARIRCTNPECREERFRPFSCKGFHLCPSCCQKRTLLFAEYAETDLLLRLPHRFLTFSLPKCLRVFFRHDRKLFSGVSRLIFDTIRRYLTEAAGTPVKTAAVLCFQSFGEFLRWNSHWHAIVLEGGFDAAGRFRHIPFGDLQQITECLRRRIVGFFLHRELISEQMAENLLRWRHSGFSTDASIVLPGGSSRKRESLAQYLARPPISLKKVSFESFGGKVLFHTSYSEYFKENLKLFSAADFIAGLTQHIPPKGVQVLRRYGLYSSRGRGTWNRKPYVAVHAPEGWKQRHAAAQDSHGEQQLPDADPPLCSAERKAAWARLIAKVYEVDPMVCPRCGSPMKVLAVITDRREVAKILRHLVKTGRSPPGLRPSSLS